MASEKSLHRIQKFHQHSKFIQDGVTIKQVSTQTSG